MPRAKKAVTRPRPKKNKKITLDPDTQELLVNHVGLSGNKDNIKRMIAFVESYLIQYHVFLDIFNKPSVGSQIKTIEDIQRQPSNYLKTSAIWNLT